MSQQAREARTRARSVKRWGTPRERLLSNVDTTDPDKCWIWQASLTKAGYGAMHANGHSYAHRVAYALFVGPIPEGLTLDHLCRNRACVNPHHLEAVSLAENKRRGMSGPAQNARRTTCLKCGGSLSFIGARRRCKPCVYKRESEARRAAK